LFLFIASFCTLLQNFRFANCGAIAGQSFYFLLRVLLENNRMEPGSDTDEKIYTLDEVKQHKDAKSLWIAIADTVYDVTPFMEEVWGADFCNAVVVMLQNSVPYSCQHKRHHYCSKNCLS